MTVVLRRLALQPFSFLTNLVVLALILTLPLLGASVLISVQPLAKEVRATPVLTIYMDPNASQAQGKEIEKRILDSGDPAISKVEFVRKEDALNQLKRNQAW